MEHANVFTTDRFLLSPFLWSCTAPQVIAVIQFTWLPGHKEAARKVNYTLLVPPVWLLFMYWPLMVLKSQVFGLTLLKNTSSCPCELFEDILSCGTKVSWQISQTNNRALNKLSPFCLDMSEYFVLHSLQSVPWWEDQPKSSDIKGVSIFCQ